jgi:hypothetical protein
MKRLSALALWFLFVAPAFGEKVEVKIPGEGWGISFDAPSLSDKEDSSRSGAYAFRGNAGRFNLSLFVEEPGSTGDSHQACYEFYWPQASRNPLIAKDTVSKSDTPKFVSVRYDIVTEYAGRPIRMNNINYYFAFRGKWIDVHVSVIQPTPADAAILDAFEASLDYR